MFCFQAFVSHISENQSIYSKSLACHAKNSLKPRNQATSFSQRNLLVNVNSTGYYQIISFNRFELSLNYYNLFNYYIIKKAPSFYNPKSNEPSKKKRRTRGFSPKTYSSPLSEIQTQVETFSLTTNINNVKVEVRSKNKIFRLLLCYGPSFSTNPFNQSRASLLAVIPHELIF